MKGRDMVDLRSYLASNVLLFDGAMGTYFEQKNRSAGAGCELSNLSQPELIADIHTAYLDAGSRAIKTNTFAVNRPVYQGQEDLVRRVIEAGWRIASDAAAGREAWVFADIGPVQAESEEEAAAEYQFLTGEFLKCGARQFLFETNGSAWGLAQAAKWIKDQAPEAFVITSFAVQPDGYTRDGARLEDLLAEMERCGAVDAAGLNCVSGARHMLELVQRLRPGKLPLAVMPNAGYPVVRGNRTYYDGDPGYFAQQVAEMAACGARIVGGCCGTTPQHIRAVADCLTRGTQHSAAVQARPEGQETEEDPGSRFWEKLRRGETVFAVELDPPKDASMTKFMAGARELQHAGVDILTIADCPIARARMDSSLLACKVHWELGLEALPHMTCRDRNLNATKALVLGLYGEGIRNILTVTGDPIPTAERDEVKSVYQFNSRKLAAYLSSLTTHELPGEMHLFGALNVNARNFDVQLRLAKEKQESGIVGFLTQPVLTERGLLNLRRAREELTGYLLGGIIPVVSERNARFMNSEINGIEVDERIIALYEGADRERGEQLAVRVSTAIAREMRGSVDGFYLMTPFQRTGLICRIMDGIRALDPNV